MRPMSAVMTKKIGKALGSGIAGSKPLRGGDIADVSLITLQDGREFVAKRPRMDQPDTTACEKMMLGFLAKNSNLPVPKVLHQSKGLLVIEYIAHAGIGDTKAIAKDVAEHIAELHQVINHPHRKASMFGFSKDTYIGPFVQQNKSNDNWAAFFRDHRLLAMAEPAFRTKRLSANTLGKIHKLADKLDSFLPTQPKASLLHGDLWAGNMLIDGDTISAFIDPAISYGHQEMDLAFIDLMGGLDPVFFDAYANLHPIDKGFWSERKYLYQLWPLLVHVRLFGGAYADQVDTILDRFI